MGDSKMLGIQWLTLEVLGACLLTAALFLFGFGAVSGLLYTDATLNAFLFTAGISAIIVFSMTRAPYENFVMLGLIIVAGAVTFASTLVLIQYNAALINTVLSYSVNLAFLVGQFRSMRIVDNAKIVKRNIIYQTLMFAVRLVWALV